MNETLVCECDIYGNCSCGRRRWFHVHWRRTFHLLGVVVFGSAFVAMATGLLMTGYVAYEQAQRERAYVECVAQLSEEELRANDPVGVLTCVKRHLPQGITYNPGVD